MFINFDGETRTQADAMNKHLTLYTHNLLVISHANRTFKIKMKLLVLNSILTVYNFCFL